MARFKSFDMTGMTNFNSNMYRSPSQITQEKDGKDENEEPFSIGLLAASAAMQPSLQGP